MIPTLRDATPDDATLVARLTREAWAGIVAPDSTGHREDEARVLRDLETGGGLIMEIDGEPVGSVRWHALPDEGAWEVKRLGLLPAHRGRGLSTWLMNEVTNRAAASGVEDLRVAVRTDQPALVRYYERMGYVLEPDLEYSGANPDNPPPVVLRRLLSPRGPRVGELH